MKRVSNTKKKVYEFVGSVGRVSNGRMEEVAYFTKDNPLDVYAYSKKQAMYLFRRKFVTEVLNLNESQMLFYKLVGKVTEVHNGTESQDKEESSYSQFDTSQDNESYEQLHLF